MLLIVFFVEEPEEVFETNWEFEVDNFDDMGLKEEVLRGIYAFGFKEPSPIQQKGILPIIQGKDTIAQVNKIIIGSASALFSIPVVVALFYPKSLYLPI